MSKGPVQSERGPHRDPARRAAHDRPPLFVVVCATALVMVVLVLIVPLVVAFVPRGGGGAAGAGAAAGMPRTLPLFLNSVLVALGVGVCATGIGLLVAWRGRGAGAFGRVLVMLPLVLPAYLSYAGWSVLRAPGSWLGDRIGSLPGARAGEVGHAANTAFAVLGMTLWLWPLATIVIGANIRKLDADLFPLIRSEARGALGRAALIVRLLRPSILLSILLIGLLVMGTAIPLHVANVPTLAISVWLALDRSPPDQAWRALLAAWPLWAIAIGAGWWLGGRATGWATGGRAARAADEALRTSGRFGGKGLVTLGTVVGLAVVAPTALLVFSMRDSASLTRFWRLSGDGVVHGLGVAAGTATAVFVIAIATGVALGARGRIVTIASGFVRAMLVLGLAPGVLVGTGLVSGWNRLDPSGTSTGGMWIEVMAHVARFGWIGAAAGCALVRLEHPNLRDLRRADGADTLRGFVRTGLALNLPLLLAAGLATGMLSFTEIEVAVVVQPPGPGNLARQILNYLHFARIEEMSAAAAWIVGSGILLTGVIGWLLMARERIERKVGGSS